MNPEIGLNNQQREGVCTILNALLADEFVLYTKTRNFHWNVKGPHFNDLHKFFEGQYDELADVVDDVAERIRSLGRAAPGSLAEFSKLARLREETGRELPGDEAAASLLKDHEALVRQLRTDLVTCQEKFGDAGTSDFLTGLMEQHEKMAWMLRAVASE